MLTFSAATFEAFADAERDAWAKRAAAKLHATYPDHYAVLDVSASDLVPLCAGVERYGARYGVKGERDVFRLVLMAASLGHRFWQDPRFRGYLADAFPEGGDPVRGVIAMGRHAKEWLRLLWADDTQAAFADRLCSHLRCDEGPAALPAILPQHYQVFAAGDHARLVDWLMESRPANGMAAPWQQLAHLALACAFGVHWHRDPQYTALASSMESAAGAADCADRLAVLLGVPA